MSKIVRTTVEMIPVSVGLLVGLTVCTGLIAAHKMGEISSNSVLTPHGSSLLLAQAGQNDEGSRRPGTGLDR